MQRFEVREYENSKIEEVHIFDREKNKMLSKIKPRLQAEWVCKTGIVFWEVVVCTAKGVTSDYSKVRSDF